MTAAAGLSSPVLSLCLGSPFLRFSSKKGLREDLDELLGGSSSLRGCRATLRCLIPSAGCHIFLVMQQEGGNGALKGCSSEGKEGSRNNSSWFINSLLTARGGRHLCSFMSQPQSDPLVVVPPQAHPGPCEHPAMGVSTPCPWGGPGPAPWQGGVQLLSCCLS